jgi:hypothetical protein
MGDMRHGQPKKDCVDFGRCEPSSAIASACMQRCHSEREGQPLRLADPAQSHHLHQIAHPSRRKPPPRAAVIKQVVHKPLHEKPAVGTSASSALSPRIVSAAGSQEHPELVDAINEYLQHHNALLKPFATASAAAILEEAVRGDKPQGLLRNKCFDSQPVAPCRHGRRRPAIHVLTLMQSAKPWMGGPSPRPSPAMTRSATRAQLDSLVSRQALGVFTLDAALASMTDLPKGFGCPLRLAITGKPDTPHNPSPPLPPPPAAAVPGRHSPAPPWQPRQ